MASDQNERFSAPEQEIGKATSSSTAYRGSHCASGQHKGNTLEPCEKRSHGMFKKSYKMISTNISDHIHTTWRIYMYQA